MKAPRFSASIDPNQELIRKSTNNAAMHYIDQRRMIDQKHRALAIMADHNSIAKSTFINLFVTLAMLLVRVLTHLDLTTARTSNPHRKLKMQLLVAYSVPAFFFLGGSAVVLLAMYLCIFELGLHLVKR